MDSVIFEIAANTHRGLLQFLPVLCQRVFHDFPEINFDLSEPDYCKYPLPVTAVIPDVKLSQPKIL